MADSMTTTLEPKAADQPAHFFRHAAARIARHSLGQVAGCRTALTEPARIQALHILTYALQLAEQWPLARDLLLLLADKLEQSSYREGWLSLLERGLQLSQQHQDAKTTAELHLRIGYLLQLSGQLDAACRHYVASATVFAHIGQPERRARVLNRYAYTTRQQQKRAQALQLVTEALALVGADHPERANAYLVRGWLAFDERHWQAACDDFANAVAILRQNGTPYQLACALRDLAVPLHLLGRDEETIVAFQQATTLFAQLENHFQQAVVTMNLGVIYLLRQQAATALDLFRQAEPVFRQLHDHEHLGQLYLNQAIAYRALGNFQQSVRLLQASLALYEQVGNVGWLANALDELAMTFWQMGEIKRTIATLQEALTVLATAPETLTYQRTQIAEHLQRALQAAAPTSETGAL